MTWSSFRLTDDEQEELSQRFMTEPRYADQRDWLQQIIPMLRKDSNGHIGIFRLVLQHLLHAFPTTAKRSASYAKVYSYYFGQLFDQDIAHRFFGFPDNFASKHPLYYQSLEQVLLQPNRVRTPPRVTSSLTKATASVTSTKAAPSVASSQPDATTLRALMRIPMLVDDDGHLVFATPMHKRFFPRYAFPSTLQELPENITIDQWLLLVLRSFQPNRLVDEQSNFKEGMLQHEFWRGASMCLPPNHHVAAEVSRVLMAGYPLAITGELDLWVNSTLEWAIELLSKGDRKGEHISRFQADGVYGPLQAKQWRCVDFRLPNPDASLPVPRTEPNYVSVVMSSLQCREALVTFPSVTSPDGRVLRKAVTLTIRFAGSLPRVWEPSEDEDFLKLAQ